jgi:hypothetical protein
VVDPAGHRRLRAGNSGKQARGVSNEHRQYDWTRIQLVAPTAPGMARWLLVRRSRHDGELAFYACYSPAATSLVGLVRVAGTR